MHKHRTGHGSQNQSCWSACPSRPRPRHEAYFAKEGVNPEVGLKAEALFPIYAGFGLIWLPCYANMGGDDLFARAQEKARKEKTTFRILTEQRLRQVLEDPGRKARCLHPLVTVRGKGLVGDFKHGGWDRIRDEIYRERAA